MDTWRRVMPGYRLKLWTTDNFDVASVPYVKEAYEHRKWAFAADYIRMYALYTEGGIYLDSDVKVLKPFDDFLSCSFFSSVEHHPTQLVKTDTARLIAPDGSRTGDGYVSGMQIQAAVMGAQAGCPFVKEVLDWYQGRHFVREDGSLETQLLAPQIYARVAERHGFLYKDMDQQLDGNVKILRSEIFAGNKHEVAGIVCHPSVCPQLARLGCGKAPQTAPPVETGRRRLTAKPMPCRRPGGRRRLCIRPRSVAHRPDFRLSSFPPRPGGRG